MRTGCQGKRGLANLSRRAPRVRLQQPCRMSRWVWRSAIRRSPEQPSHRSNQQLVPARCGRRTELAFRCRFSLAARNRDLRRAAGVGLHGRAHSTVRGARPCTRPALGSRRSQLPGTQSKPPPVCTTALPHRAGTASGARGSVTGKEWSGTPLRPPIASQRSAGAPVATGNPSSATPAHAQSRYPRSSPPGAYGSSRPPVAPDGAPILAA